MDGFNLDGALALLADRVESQGVATARVSDGMIFIFSQGHIERMLEDAKSAPRHQVVVFVKDGPMKKGNA